MKKFLGLVLALVMILTAVSAFAAIPSKTTKNLVEVKSNTEDVTVTATDNDSEEVVTLLATLIVNNAIPDELKDSLPEGSTVTKIEDAVTLKIDGGTAEKDLVVNLKLTTSYEENKEFIVLLGAMENGKIVEWRSVKAIGQKDGSINMVLPGSIQDWLGGREFIALIAA